MFKKAKRFTKEYVRSGDLKHRITIQKKDIGAPTGMGVDMIQTYTDIVEVWAAIDTVAPRIPFEDVNIDEQPTHRFYIRFFSGIDVNHWVFHEGKRYPILSIRNIGERNEWLVLNCNEKGKTTSVASSW